MKYLSNLVFGLLEGLSIINDRVKGQAEQNQIEDEILINELNPK